MKNDKVDMKRLSELSKLSNGNMEVNTTWTIPVGEFTFTLATTVVAAHNSHKHHK
ncbi:hypothetical protein [uncultured Secundilactobacillus sp.]|uniref:hypothetical protein n=1 Tax=uncultured Secundilactobacillus sp. TaxID=2813935 RepID=UPI0025894BFE|nr:hypothetical protein [uncultured Secundilactobacillus sp.]